MKTRIQQHRLSRLVMRRVLKARADRRSFDALVARLPKMQFGVPFESAQSDDDVVRH